MRGRLRPQGLGCGGGDWNFWAFPKWQYTIPFVEFAKVFEMPLPGYGGYLAFGLETYAAYHFLVGVVQRVGRGWWRDLRWEGLARAE